MGEYYMIEVIMSTGAAKYLILRETACSGLVIFDKWEDRVGAIAMLEYLNKEGK